MSPEPTSREEALAVALRDALREALAQQLAKTGSIRQFAERMGCDKSLGWKLWRMATAPTGRAVLQVFPKARGVSKLLAAVKAKSGSPALVEAAAKAARDLLDCRVHAVAQFQLPAAERDGYLTPSTAQLIPQARLTRAAQRKAFEHQFALDSQALERSVELRIGAFLLRPDGSGHRADLAACALVCGPRTNRSDASVIVHTPICSWEGDGGTTTSGESSAGRGFAPGFQADLSTPGIHQGQFSCDKPTDKVKVYEWRFQPRPGTPEVLAFLELVRGAGSIWSAEPHDFAALSMAIMVPTRRAILDIWVHRAYPTPDMTASSRRTEAIIPNPAVPSTLRPSPLPDGVLLECRKPGLGTEHAQHESAYRALVAKGAAALGSSMSEYRLFRLDARFPEYRSFQMVDWPLPGRPRRD